MTFHWLVDLLYRQQGKNRLPVSPQRKRVPLLTALLRVRAIWFDAWQGSRGVDRWLERRYDQGDQTRRMHAGSSRPSPDRNRRRVLIGIVRTASRVPLALEHPPRPASSRVIQYNALPVIPFRRLPSFLPSLVPENPPPKALPPPPFLPSFLP